MTRIGFWRWVWVRVSPYDPRLYRLRPVCDRPPLTLWAATEYIACNGCGGAHRRSHLILRMVGKVW